MNPQIDPVPSDDEAAAILAAYEALWPKPAPDAVVPRTSTVWRFSGRWWSAPAHLSD